MRDLDQPVLFFDLSTERRAAIMAKVTGDTVTIISNTWSPEFGRLMASVLSGCDDDEPLEPMDA